MLEKNAMRIQEVITNTGEFIKCLELCFKYFLQTEVLKVFVNVYVYFFSPTQNIEEFLSCLDSAADACGILVKKGDKKKERYLRLFH